MSKLRIAENLSLPADAVTQTDIAWVAGLFEGEGCILHSQQKRGKSRGLTLTSTDRDVVERAWRIFGAGTIIERPAAGPRKRCWRWKVQKWLHVKRIGLLLLPYLCERRRAKMLTLLADAPTKGQGFCPRGHPLWGPAADVYKYPGKSPDCAICTRERERLRRLRKRVA